MLEKKSIKLSKKWRPMVEELGLSIGDVIISKKGVLSYITDICMSEYSLDKAIICYQEIGGRDSTVDVSQFEYHGFIRVGPGPVSTSYEQLLKAYEAEAMHQLQNPDFVSEDDEEPDTVALVHSQGIGFIEAVKSGVEQKHRDAEIVKRIVERKLAVIGNMIHVMEKQVKQMKKVIAVFELYLGLNEKIIQIASGAPAHADEPVSVRQLVLYMDEEVGDPTSGGIDWTRVDEFDDWVFENYKLILPEPRGIVALRPSRQKRWQQGWFGDFFAVQQNDYRCYLLIRNGDNLYRIWVNMRIDDVLFPTEAEMLKVIKQITDGWGFDKERAQDAQLRFSRNAMLVQGLFDRTDLLQPMSHPVNVRDPECLGIKYIYDAELTLPDGQVSYDAWKRTANELLGRGSRVYIAPNIGYHVSARSGYRRRFARSYGKYNGPPIPKPGVYTVERVTPAGTKFSRQEALWIMYNPGDKVYGNWYQDRHERKHRLSFALIRQDDFVFNFDLVDLEAVEFYINRRQERSKYLEVMPVLYGIRRMRLEEMEWEGHFVNLVSNETGKSFEEVWQAIAWWKNRVIWKRPINKDDTKAHRMIKRKLRGAWSDE